MKVVITNRTPFQYQISDLTLFSKDELTSLEIKDFTEDELLKANTHDYINDAFVVHTKTQLEIEVEENMHKSRRASYIDAYRKYQAAVNYGEFERVPEVDDFIAALRNKDWSAFESVPPQIKYFAGECGFEESRLRKEEII